MLGLLHPLCPSVPAEAGHQFQLLVILLFLTDVNDGCYHDYNVP